MATPIRLIDDGISGVNDDDINMWWNDDSGDGSDERINSSHMGYHIVLLSSIDPRHPPPSRCSLEAIVE